MDEALWAASLSTAYVLEEHTRLGCMAECLDCAVVDTVADSDYVVEDIVVSDCLVEGIGFDIADWAAEDIGSGIADLVALADIQDSSSLLDIVPHPSQISLSAD
jgi:hypothetical protein